MGTQPRRRQLVKSSEREKKVRKSRRTSRIRAPPASPDSEPIQKSVAPGTSPIMEHAEKTSN